MFDAQNLADLIKSPDRIGWRMSEDPALMRAMVWNDQGERRYPPPDGLVPLTYEFSEDMTRLLTTKQADTQGSSWSDLDTAEGALLHCRTTPAVCLVYRRDILEEVLDLHAGTLMAPAQWRVAELFFATIAVVSGIGMVWLRRRPSISSSGFKILPERHLAMHGSFEVALTPRDVRLLTILKERGGDVVTKDELYDAGWGRDYMSNSRALEQHMINLRQKLDPDKSRPALIETVHGVGYRLVR